MDMLEQNNPFFSIAIPAYKCAFLAEAIDSCLAQSFANFELVIVDDASPEDINGVVANYQDSRIRYYRNARNCGAIDVVDNWNICLGYCRGEYVICMGDDDRLLPKCLDEYARLIAAYPDLNVYHAWTELIDEQGRVIKQLSQRPEYQGCMSMIWQLWSGDAQYIGDFCFKTDHLRSVGGFYKLPLAWGADHVTTIRAAVNSGIANAQKITFQYRENVATISSSGNNAIKIEAKLIERKWFEDFLRKVPQIKDKEELKFYRLIKDHYEDYYRNEVLIYIKKYFHESLSNIFPIIKKYRRYRVPLAAVIKVYLKVVKYELTC